jgi:dihydropteroate synthase
MGVLNVTPDSFSDGGRHLAVDAAIAEARAMLVDGADCLDIGGEATSPGTTPLEAAEELPRIEPIVARLAGEAVLSIDTYHASTAARCLELGARIVNDVSALRADPAMADVVREHGAVLVMMHAKDGPLPHASDRPKAYGDVVREIGDFLQERVELALSRGIAADRLVLDPGWGRFVSLDPAHSFELLRRFDALVERFRPIPLLVGTSRKGFLGVPMADRDPVSQLTALAAVARGAMLVRTHAPRMMRQFLDLAEKAGLTPASPPGP